jgi:hypothetical protein
MRGSREDAPPSTVLRRQKRSKALSYASISSRPPHVDRPSGGLHVPTVGESQTRQRVAEHTGLLRCDGEAGVAQQPPKRDQVLG